MISVLSAVAEIERENIRVQTMAGREQKAREGKWNGGFAHYGYKLVNNELLIADDKVEIIKIIYDRYIHTGEGLSGVAEQSEFPIYEGQHEAILSEEEWNLVQIKRKKNAYKREKVNNPDHAHILSGILKCPCCGKALLWKYCKSTYGKEAFTFRENSIVVTIPLQRIKKVGKKVGDKVGNKKGLNARRQRIITEMRDNPNITTSELHQILAISETAVENNLTFLKENGYVERVGAKKTGYWKVLE